MRFWHGFDDDDLRAGIVTLVEFRIKRTGEGLGIVGNDGDAGKAATGRNVGMRDHV